MPDVARQRPRRAPGRLRGDYADAKRRPRTNLCGLRRPATGLCAPDLPRISANRSEPDGWSDRSGTEIPATRLANRAVEGFSKGGLSGFAPTTRFPNLPEGASAMHNG